MLFKKSKKRKSEAPPLGKGRGTAPKAWWRSQKDFSERGLALLRIHRLMKLVVAFPSVWRERFFLSTNFHKVHEFFFVVLSGEKTRRSIAPRERRGANAFPSRRGFFILLPGAATRYARLPRAIFFRPVGACFYLKKNRRDACSPLNSGSLLR